MASSVYEIYSLLTATLDPLRQGGPCTHTGLKGCQRERGIKVEVRRSTGQYHTISGYSSQLHTEK